MSYGKNRGIKLLAVVLALCAVVPAWSGESKGWLVIEGGSNPLNPIIAQKFRDLIGGADAKVLLIPTAADDERIEQEIKSGGVEKFAHGQLGLSNYNLFNSRDPKETNSEPFVAQIRTVKGVWFGGGRPGRLAQAYLGTRVQQELQAFYDRGGVIGGLSAGAMIMSSFLVRGGIEDADFHQLTSQKYHEGLGFLKNTVIDSHVNQRHGEGDMVEVVAAHPELLGIGIDTGTAIVVHGHSFQVIGGPDARVIITDGKQHDGKSYYSLKLGDHFDLNKHTVE